MDTWIKNIAKGEILQLQKEIPYQDGQIVSKTLAQNERVSLTLFAFEKGEEIRTHASQGDAMVTILDGAGRMTIAGKEYMLTSGETMVIPAGTPHAVYAQERFKMLLTAIL